MRQALFRMTDRLDVLIFGASGFTGKYTVFQAVSVLDNLKWGIAGRNKSKLEDVLKEMGAKAKTNLSHIPIVTADVSDQKSLVEMAKKCKVLVNCCGPYRFIGEPVVKACIEAGTHHVDVSGEPQFMESMQLKYHKMAEEKGVYIVSACGFDSIPTEMGLVFIEKNFDGIVNSVETYLSTRATAKTRRGAGVHYGTWESAVHAIANATELEEIRAKLFTTKMPKFQPHLKIRPLMFRSDVVKGVSLPFPGPDRAVVMRSQRFLYETEKKRPVQMHAYITFPSYISAFFVAMFGVFFGLMTKFALGRHLLLKYPKVFTLGFVSHEGPAEATMEAIAFKITMKAEGWPKSEKLVESTDQFTDPPSKSLMVRVSGTNPGYGATCVALLSTAKTILKDSDKMPGKGGVLPPGAAFAKTSLISELEKHEGGLKFEILANK